MKTPQTLSWSGPAYEAGPFGEILARLANGELEPAGVLLVEAPEAPAVIGILNRAAAAQDRRRYSQAARLYASVEGLVAWNEAELDAAVEAGVEGGAR